MDAHIGAAPPLYGAWRPAMEAAPDVERLLAIVRDYLASWSPAAMAQLPAELSCSALPVREAIYAGAFLARRAELVMNHDDPRHPALEQMALFMATAAMRLRVLESYESVVKMRAANLVVPAAPATRLRAEVRHEDV